LFLRREGRRKRKEKSVLGRRGGEYRVG